MKSLDWKTIVIAALIAVVVLMARGTEPARAGSGTDSNADMIAVTGEYGNGTSVLWVIDTKSKQLAVYKSPNGNGVELIAARKIEYDLKLPSYGDRTTPELHPIELAKTYQRYVETGRVKPSATTPAVEEKK